MISFKKALSHFLKEIEEPVLTRYRIGVLVYKIYSTKTVEGEDVRLGKESATQVEFARAMKILDDNGILEAHPSFEEKAYRLIGRTEVRAEEIACSIDPFCYVSHLSAMAHHGLTNRLPSKLLISSPDSRSWQERARSKMSKDLGEDLEDYLSAGLPRLEKLTLERVNRTEVHRFNTKQHSSFTKIKGRTARVSTIGRTFLDMLRHPELCGGMHHVIEIFEEHAGSYLQAIVSEVDKSGGPIDKVRAGYILDEMLDLDDPAIRSWEAFIARGGSRKLDPSEAYVPTWSEKWCLSLNT